MPTDLKERERVLFSALDKGRDIQSFPEYFVPYDEQVDKVLMKGRPIAELLNSRPEAERIIQQMVERLHEAEKNILFLPMRTQRDQDLTAVIGGSDGRLLDIIQVDPWINDS